MKIKLIHVALLFFAFSLPLSAFSQGSLTPPGAPAPTMKTLDQIETRTPISTPYTISTPGSYYLTTNVLVGIHDAIIIAANNVTLDLNGFTISSIESPASTGSGIKVGTSGSGAVMNVTILNGFISSGVTNNNGTFAGNGFGYGIYNLGLPSRNVHVSGVTITGCRFAGIYLGTANNTLVESCIVDTVGSYGIYAQTVVDSTAQNCGIYAIYATSSANNCSGDGIINGSGIFAVIANNCHGTGSGSGSGLIATNANNCFGDALGSGTGLSCRTANNCNGTSSSGNGLAATTAINCSGSSTSANGIYATTAQSCSGSSGSGNGIYATTAINCSGSGSGGIYASSALNCSGSSSSQSGTGIYATSAQNCNGSSNNYGIGIYATSSAIGCFGSSFGDTGLYAFIANSCHGSGPTPINYTHNVSSF